MIVEVPETVCPLTHEQLEGFTRSLNSLHPADFIRLYVDAKAVLREILPHDD